MTRPSREQWAMRVAQVTAERSTCLRRNVGCVLLDADGFILATGVNGVASGMKHCNEPMLRTTFARPDPGPSYPHACPGAQALSGIMLDGCHAIHAEQNALLRCGDIRRVHSVFCTASPCMTCVKLLMNTSCLNIYYLEEYPHSEAMNLWLSSRDDREWIQMELN